MRPCSLLSVILALILALISATPASAEGVSAGAVSFSNISVELNHTTIWGAVTSGSQSVLYRSTDQARTWLPIRYQADLTKNPSILDVAAHLARPGTVFFTTKQAGGYLWKTADGGNTWTNPGAAFQGIVESELGVRNTRVMIQPDPSHTIYVQFGSRLFRSLDDGATFDAGVQTPCVAAIFDNTLDPLRLVCHNSTNLYFSVDGGRTWTQGASPGGGLLNCTLVNSPQAAETYFGECLGSTGNFQDDFWFRTTNTFRNITASAEPVGLPQFFVSRDHTVILASGSGIPNLIRSRDLGQTWETTTGPNSAFFFDFAFDSTDANIVYRRGKEKSTNAGSSFTSLDSRYVPLLASQAPVLTTLEAGTVLVRDIRVTDVLGASIQLRNFEPPIATSVPWIDTGFDTAISAIGLTPGVYATQLQIGPSSIAVALNVIARKEPPAYFKVTRLQGLTTSISSPTTPGPVTGEGGLAVNAPIAFPKGLAADPAGNVYLAYDSIVQRISPDGTLTRYAGTGANATSTGNGGPAVNATFRSIRDLLWTSDGLLIYDSFTGEIRRVRSNGIIESVATGAILGVGMARDASGTIYVGHATQVSRVQGSSLQPVFQMNSVPTVDFLLGLTIDPTNNDFILLTTDRVIRRSVSGNTSTLAGTAGQVGFAGDGSLSATGTLIDADSFAWITAGADGAVYFTDANRLRVVTPNGTVGTVAGDGRVESTVVDGTYATAMGIGEGYRVAVLPSGQIFYVAFLHLLRLDPAAAPPSRYILPGGIVTITGRPKVSPGQVISIYGVDLATNALSASSVPLATTLDGVSVEVNNVKAPLFYVSPGLINLQLPYETALGTAKVKVIRNGAVTPEETVQVIQVAPDVLVYNGNRAVAVNANGQINSPSAPAAKGTFITLYLCGVGPVNNPPATGAPAVADPLSRALLAHSVNFTPASGQSTAPVNTTAAFLGLTPTGVGLVQANIEIPASLPPGEYDMTLTIGGVASNVTRVTVGP